MESLLTLTPWVKALIREVLVAFHAFAACVGIGGSFVARLYRAQFMAHKKIQENHIKIMRFFHHVIMMGLWSLVVSGFALLVFFYFFEPATLWNAKIYAKILLTIYLLFLAVKMSSYIFKTINMQIGKHIFQGLSASDISRLIYYALSTLILWISLFVMGSIRWMNLYAHNLWQMFAYMCCYILPLVASFVVVFIMSKVIGELIAEILEEDDDKDQAV
ncbi:MAG: hypothetical protein ACE365_00905 [Gammaproteobacteria bacterium]